MTQNKNRPEALTRQSAAQTLTDLSAGRLSAAELMRATLDRIAQVNGPLNAIVALRDPQDLMAEARAADHATDRVANRGPLHGLPIAVKDLVNVAGIVSSQGSPLFAGHVPVVDDLIAARMRAAGAILIGKTNTPEFGLGSHTFNQVYGVTRNPYDLCRSCGGSSGGAAVALASGMVALADGSDMMGSLRNPAAWNNVYGFRPSWGRVPSDPVGETFLHQLATPGPMARSPEDLAILLDVISGPDPRVPHGHECGPVSPLRPADTRGIRIGWLDDWGGAFAMEPGIRDTAGAALGVLEGLGCHVQALAPPFSADSMWESWVALRSWAVAARLAQFMDCQDSLKDTVIREVNNGLALSAMDVQRASEIRSDWFRRATALFQDYDALVLPAAQVWPFDAEIAYPREIAGQKMDSYHRWMQVVLPVSLIGLPCLAAPAGFGAQGLPMGVQIFGPRGSDAALLALGAAYHAATGWPQRFPAAPRSMTATKEARP
jgi:amidase